MQLKLRGFLLLFRDSIEFFTLFVSMPLLRIVLFKIRQNVPPYRESPFFDPRRTDFRPQKNGLPPGRHVTLTYAFFPFPPIFSSTFFADSQTFCTFAAVLSGLGSFRGATHILDRNILNRNYEYSVTKSFVGLSARAVAHGQQPALAWRVNCDA